MLYCRFVVLLLSSLLVCFVGNSVFFSVFLGGRGPQSKILPAALAVTTG